jgi:hypothetical protein
MGSLSSATGMDLKPSNDRILSEILGDERQPDIRLAELTKDTTPQILNSVINNTFTVDVDIAVDGAGEPGEVAERVGDVFEDMFESKIKQASNMVKVIFDR